MIVPRHWAEAKSRRRIKGRQVTVKRYGWSDASEADARKHAQERVDEALARMESGARVPRSEPKVPYNGADGVPIREEIVRSHDDVVITRNAYGALCLNTPDVLFADVDYVVDPSVKTYVGSCLFLLLCSIAAVVGAMIAGYVSSPWALLLGGIIASAILFMPLAVVAFRVVGKFRGSPEVRAMNRVRLFSKKNPDWHLRLYRTPAGLRVLVMHATFDPNAPETLALFQQLKTDPLYARMCRKQKCFRARLTPKPWRIGYAPHLKPRPGVWPINPARMPDRLRWIDGYEATAKGFAACRFIERLGSTAVDPKAELVRSLHDSICKSDTGLEIA